MVVMALYESLSSKRDQDGNFTKNSFWIDCKFLFVHEYVELMGEDFSPCDSKK